jgi:hypothetical protein
MNDSDTPDNALSALSASANSLLLLPPAANPSTAINHVSETNIDPALLHAACIPTQTPSGERIPKEQFEAQLYVSPRSLIEIYLLTTTVNYYTL